MRDAFSERPTNALWAAGVILLIGWIGFTWVSMPIVQRSHSTGECVRVIPSNAGTCSAPPVRYISEVVK